VSINFPTVLRDLLSIREIRSRVSFREQVPAQPVDATPSDIDFSSKGGVHDRTEARKAFCGAESRFMESLTSFREEPNDEKLGI
jgi:hypothetical protein